MNSISQILRPRNIILFSGALILVLVILYIAQSRYIASQAESIETLIEDYSTIKAASIDLEEQISFTYTDTYIEREARRRLGLIHEGEVLYEQNGAVETPD
ncbi:MAG: septum formation initiator family protein [Clostridia bacterium]|nr:septum formation initiator family protein [Clostridia bacterium]